MQPAPAAGPAAPTSAAPAFIVGDRFPNFILPDAAGVGRDFYAEVTGRPALLLLAAEPTTEPLRRAAHLAATVDLDFFAVLGAQPASSAPGLALHDVEGRLLSTFLGSRGWRLFLLDPNQRALALPEGAPEEQFAEAAGAVAAWRRFQGEPQVRRGGAPVLLLPDVLPADLCGTLIALWHQSHREGAVSTGAAENIYAADRKRNREHDVKDAELTRQIARHIVRRVGPELAKVFNFTQRYTMEPFIVLGYDPERRDFFGRHRDRYKPEHPRRFALSLNLNDAFEGGALRFPEYSQDLYSPPAGGACVFSCALLHEALPVTSGFRFAMTTFFHAAP